MIRGSFVLGWLGGSIATMTGTIAGGTLLAIGIEIGTLRPNVPPTLATTLGDTPNPTNPTSRPSETPAPLPTPPAVPNAIATDTASILRCDARFAIFLDSNNNPIAVDARESPDVEWYTTTTDYVMGEARRLASHPRNH